MDMTLNKIKKRAMPNKRYSKLPLGFDPFQLFSISNVVSDCFSYVTNSYINKY